MRKAYLGTVCESSGSYGIVFRDFPGCVSAAESLEQVLVRGAEALALHIDGMENDGDLVPIPTVHDLGAVLEWLGEADDPSGDTWLGVYPVTVDLPEHPQSVAVPVAREIVEEIADIIESRRSSLGAREFIEDATRRELDRLKKSA